MKLSDAKQVRLGSTAVSALYVGDTKVWPSTDPATDAFVAASGLDSSFVPALDILVTGLKANNLWSTMSAVYPFIGGTADTHKFNLVDPRDSDAAYRLSFNGPYLTHSTTAGFMPNPAADYSTGWADTHLVAEGTLDPTSVHLSLYSLGELGNAPRCDMGAYNWDGSGGRFHLIVHYTSGEYYYSLGHRGTPNVPGGAGSGMYVSSRVSVNEEYAYRNGALLGGNGNAPTGLPYVPVLIGALHSYPRECSDLKFGFASIGAGLSSQDTANLYTVVQAYQAALGRAV